MAKTGHVKDRVAISVYLPVPMMSELRAMAEKYGVSYSNMATMAIQTGMASIRLASDPTWKPYFESILKAEDAQKIMEHETQADRGTNNP